MMVLCVRDILDWVRSHTDFNYKILISYLEVYNEEINDLLGEQGPASKNLKIVSEDAVRGAVIGGLVEEVAVTAEDFMAILQRGEASRSYASTNMNAESSRSHTIYRVSIEAREKHVEEGQEEISQNARVSYLNLVDLAGSERQKSTKAEGKVLKEGANINKSLLALAAVINKLGESTKKMKGAKPAFIPYRDSRLTRILKQSLGGNTLTSILCAVTPAPMHREETVSTLKFGQTCKNIKNNVKSNDGLLDDKAMIRQLKAAVAELKCQLEDGEGGGSRKNEQALENKVAVLHGMLVAQGVSSADIAAALGSGTSATGTMPSQDDSHYQNEIAKLSDRAAEQAKAMLKLTRKLAEYADLEESKASLEDYEHHLRQELDDARSKLEEEKSTLTQERHKLLKDRTAVDEKESRIGILVTNLDEKESKLRQMMATMREQSDQWQRSITDLQRREDLVDDWQRNHKQREKKLLEIEALQDKKFLELNQREGSVIEDEHRAKALSHELIEREQRLQVSLSRITHAEVENKSKEEALLLLSESIKKNTHLADVRDRELASRRKELESWDVLLREKDRKVGQEQRDLDDREVTVKANEDKVKRAEVELDKKAIELRAQEAHVLDMVEKYEKLNAELDEKEKDFKERDRELGVLRKELANREEELKRWEKQLKQLSDSMRGIEAREKALQKAEEGLKNKSDEFYNVQVAQITSRHNQELRAFEDIIQKQLKIGQDFQKELEAARLELAQRVQETADMEAQLEAKQQLVEHLQLQLARLDGSPVEEFDSPLPEVQSSPEQEEVVEKRQSMHPQMMAAHLPPQQVQQLQAQAQQQAQGDFMSQLSATRQLIYQVLDKYNALPVPGRRVEDLREDNSESERRSRRRGGVENMASHAAQATAFANASAGMTAAAVPPPPPPAAPLAPTPPQLRQTSSAYGSFEAPHPPQIVAPRGYPQHAQQMPPQQVLSPQGQMGQGGQAQRRAVPYYEEKGQQQQHQQQYSSPPPAVHYAPGTTTAHMRMLSPPAAAGSPIKRIKGAMISPTPLAAAKSLPRTPSGTRKSNTLFNEELAGIVTVGEVDAQGVPVVGVNLIKRSGIKKFAMGMH